MIKISVILPVKEPEPFLNEACKSILNQSFKKFEIIIIFDQKNICPKQAFALQQMDKKIRIFKNPGIGLSDALNFGIKKAKTEYICRMDADDIADKNRLKIQYHFLQKNKQFFLVGSNIKYFGMLNYTKKYPENNEECFFESFFSNPFAHSAIFFRKKIFLELNGYSKKYPYNQDYHLICKAFKNGKKCHNIQQNLLEYRVRPGSMTSKISQEKKSEFERKIIEDFIRSTSISNKKKFLKILFRIKFYIYKKNQKLKVSQKDFIYLFKNIIKILSKKYRSQKWEKYFLNKVFFLLCVVRINNKKNIFIEISRNLKTQKLNGINLFKIIILKLTEKLNLNINTFWTIKKVANLCLKK